ncbi:hypothetical protein GCM10027055_08810 [Janibacter alkaliphilus]|uniref:Alkaline shock response membrane anchor protein AmaP n=1 Tax=Janibacter alkaliphilus TaxID=1069963 RepID=A0A852XC27_9MICO|nr:hypothetical protein [Janibacter alkaliphilus]NYG36051.1 hypothetical protein [Janibacter alkaliphilus]
MKPPIVTDRLVGVVVGLLLLAGGLLLIGWYGGWLLSYPDELGTAPVADVVGASWFPWAAAAVGIVLGLIGLWWFFAHLRRDVVGTLRLGDSGPAGRVQVELDTVADSVAARFAELAPVSSSQGSTTETARRQGVVVEARLLTGADVDLVVEAARRCTDEVEQAFPDGSVSCRFLVDEPKGQGRRPLRRSAQQVRVT